MEMIILVRPHTYRNEASCIQVFFTVAVLWLCDIAGAILLSYTLLHILQQQWVTASYHLSPGGTCASALPIACTFICATWPIIHLWYRQLMNDKIVTMPPRLGDIWFILPWLRITQYHPSLMVEMFSAAISAYFPPSRSNTRWHALHNMAT